MNLKSIRKLALTLPGFPSISQPDKLKTEFVDLASFLSGLLNIIFYIAIFLTFYWLIWGASAYILAQGEKEKLARARERIKWAIIGLLVILMSYSIAKFASEIFPPGKGGLPF